jgi:hypothetical protein
MRLQVDKVVSHGLHIRELWLKLPDGSDLPRWEAGSHIGLTLPVDQGNLADVLCNLIGHHERLIYSLLVSRNAKPPLLYVDKRLD